MENLTIDNELLNNPKTIETITNWYEYINENGATTKHLTVYIDRDSTKQTTTIENIFKLMAKNGLFFKAIISGPYYEKETILTDANNILDYIAKNLGNINKVYLSKTNECINWYTDS